MIEKICQLSWSGYPLYSRAMRSQKHHKWSGKDHRWSKTRALSKNLHDHSVCVNLVVLRKLCEKSCCFPGQFTQLAQILHDRWSWQSQQILTLSGQENIIGGQENIISGQENIISGQENIIGGQDNIKGGQENILNGQSHSPKTSSAILTSKDHPSGIQLRGKFLESFTAKISPYISCKLGQQNDVEEKYLRKKM